MGALAGTAAAVGYLRHATGPDASRPFAFCIENLRALR